MNGLFLRAWIASCGALALVGQVVLVRQLLVAFNGHETILAVVLAGWLAGVFLGAWAAGRCASSAGIRWGLRIGPALWLATLGAILDVSFRLPGLTGLAPGEVVPLDLTLAWVGLLTVPASAFVGWLFVLAGTALLRHPDRPAGGATVFWLESTGSGLGLLIYTYGLAGRIGPIETMIWFGGPMLICWGLFCPRTLAGRVIMAGLPALVLATVPATGWPTALDRQADRLRFTLAHPAYELVAARETPYQHLALASRGREMTLFGNQNYYYSWPDPEIFGPPTIFFLTEAPAHRRVLLAGQGPGGFIHELLARNVETLVYVALDPAETGLIAAHLPADLAADLTDPRLTIVHDDLRTYLSATDQTFDLILVNAPDPDNGQINRLYTLEFFQAARSRLGPEGVLATSISGAENYWSRELLSYGLCLFATLKTVFPQVLVTPGDRHYFLAGSRNGILSDDPLVLAQRFRERGFASPYMTAGSFPLFFPPTGRDYLKERLAWATTEGAVRLNTDAAPLSYALRLIWWEKLTGGKWSQALLTQALKIRYWGPVAALLLVWPWLVVWRRPTPARVALWTMAQTGAVAMALNVILIFIYQNRFGIIFERLGLVSAVFMAGLALGGAGGRAIAGDGPTVGQVRAVHGPANGRAPEPWIRGAEFLLAGLGILTFRAAGSPVGQGSILALVGLTGLAAGAEFALLLALKTSSGPTEQAGKTLSRLEAADHAGAVVGALATGLVLVPALGLGTTALALAGLKLLSGLAQPRHL